MRGLAGIALVGCMPGEGGDAYVLADRGAWDTPLRVDGQPVDARLPVAVAPEGVLDTSDGATELGADEVALVQGSAGRVTLYVLGVDLEPDLVEASGPEDQVTGLAEDLGVDLERVGDRWMLADPDLWPLLAEAEPQDEVALRPVSGLDLPGIAPIGDARPSGDSAPRATPRTAPASAVASLLGLAARQPVAEADRARLRAEALFALEPGAAELAPAPASRSAAALVGRYCGADTTLTLGASGAATVCDADGCRGSSWTVDGGEVQVEGDRFAVEEQGRGQRLVGQERLVDLVIGGCP